MHDAIREMYPNKSVLAVFQPHLFSRTHDFADAFAASLSRFDHVLLLDIYPAREQPMPGITSAWLMDKMTNPNSKLVQKSDLVSEIKKCPVDVLVTMGAGDIGLEIKNIKKELEYEI